MSEDKQKKSLSNLKKTQYDEGAYLTLQNAENLFEIAKLCNQKGFAGNGASILITSLEELAKAAYLKIKAHNPHIVVKELEGFFKYHKVKHGAIAQLYIKIFKKLPQQQQEAFGLAILFGIFYIAYASWKTKQSVALDLETIRQRGYYVNFIEDENRWKAPKDLVSSEDFPRFIELAEKLFKNVKKDLFEGKLTDEHTKQYIQDLDDENVYFQRNYKVD